MLLTRQYDREVKSDELGGMRQKTNISKLITHNLKGFTLLEVVIAFSIFLVALCGSLKVFLYSTTLADSARNTVVMWNRARTELENVILLTNFDSLNSLNGQSTLLSINRPNDARLIRYVQDHNSIYCPNQTPNNLKEVRIVICYREKANRIVGEDLNLNGVLDAGEDTNGDGRISSPCEIVTYVMR